jgi:hypothetical protein
VIPIPQPTADGLHIDVYLTDVSVAYAQDQKNFIATKVFPRVPVMKQSDKFAIYPRGFFNADSYQVRPMGGRPRQIGYEVDQGQYFCEEYAAEHKIDDRVRANYDQPLDPDRAAMRLLTSQGLIRQDRMWATSFFGTGIWGSDQTGVASAPSGPQFLQFDQADSDPISFFDERIETMGGATGVWPNTLVLGASTYRGLRNNPDILERIKFTQRAIVGEDLLASLLGVDQVLVARAVYNTAAEGQTDTEAFIVDATGALLTYAAPTPALDQPTGGYNFTWTGLLGSNEMGAVIERGREELAHSDVFQGRMAFDPQLVAADLGEFYTSCVSS